jgi:serine phosphatase RsbU (regulator of sigma subunit)
MLQLSDLFRLHQAGVILKQLHESRPGLVIVSGREGKATLSGEGANIHSNDLLPSGRSMVFRTLLDEIFRQDLEHETVLVAMKDQAESMTGWRSWRKVRTLLVDPPVTYAEQLFNAVESQPHMLLVDRLDQHSVVPVFEMASYGAKNGMRTFTQLDCPFLVEGVLRHLQRLGVSPDQFYVLTWILTVHRLPALCPDCRREVHPDAHTLERLQHIIQSQNLTGSSFSNHDGDRQVFRSAQGCAKCQFTGRRGDVAVLEICRFEPGNCQVSLPVEHCLWNLVQTGNLAVEDLIYFREDQQQRLFHQLSSTEGILLESIASLARTRSELQAASRVLNRRNQALFSFQDIGYALIRSDDLYDLAQRICRHAQEISEADRVMLYILYSGDQAEIAASIGWDGVVIHSRLDTRRAFDPFRETSMISYRGLPPGVPAPKPLQGEKYDDFLPKGGVFVALQSQEERVGVMIVQSMSKKQFPPGETAMLQTFANQAALALQRAALVADLRSKIAQLEAAQVELAEKERMLHEMELARRVQRSVLPQAFPDIPGFEFAARYQAARQVGGDFYDVINLDDDHFGIAIADVSDKGMPAALFMALTRSLLLAQAHIDSSPLQVLMKVNQLLLELSASDMFVTIFYGVIDRSRRVISYVRAGHDRPVLIRSGQSVDLEGKGMALGVIESEQLDLEERQVDLIPGDRLVLYTDGLTDASTVSEQFYGRQRLVSLLIDFAGARAGEYCRTIFDTLQTYQGNAEQFDDMTILVVDVG